MSGFYIHNDKYIAPTISSHLTIPGGSNLCDSKCRTLKPLTGSIAFGVDTRTLYIAYDNQWNPIACVLNMAAKEIS